MLRIAVVAIVVDTIAVLHQVKAKKLKKAVVCHHPWEAAAEEEEDFAVEDQGDTIVVASSDVDAAAVEEVATIKDTWAMVAKK